MSGVPSDATASASVTASAEVLPLIERLDVEDAARLRAHPAVFTYEPLPFYTSAGVLRATAMLPERPVAFRYVLLRDELRLLPLGTPEQVLDANAAAGLRLVPDTSLAYLRFYLENAGGGRDTRRLVERPQDVLLLPPSEGEPTLLRPRNQVTARVHQARVEERMDGGLRITAILLRARTLEAVTYGIDGEGHVSADRVTVLQSDVPIVEVL